MNKMIIIGNLTADPELARIGEKQTAKATFRLGVRRRFEGQGGERISDFFPVIVWGKMAENCAKYLCKGAKVMCEGEMQNRSYTAQDGQKRYIWELIASNVEFLTSTGGTAGTGENQADANGFTPVEDDELPF